MPQKQILESSQIVNDPSVIDLGIGQPELEILPKELAWRAAQRLLSDPDMRPLNYGHPKGDGDFRQALSRFLAPYYQHKPAPDSFIATNGASQALYFLTRELTKPRQTILVEEPTYFLALEIFRGANLKIVGVPTGESGVDLEKLASLAKKHKPVFFYTIPTFHNPTGRTTPQETRASVVELAKTHNFKVVADEVYQALAYSSSPPPPYAQYLPSDVVISVGSFSKILAPGLRLGWIQCSPDLQAKLLTSGLLRSGGGMNQFTCCLVREALKSGDCDRYLGQLHKIYGYRIEVMDRCLQRDLGDLVEYHKPTGGYFFWLKLPKKIDIQLLEDQAKNHGVGFRAGNRFATGKSCKNYIRLSFARYAENAIDVGIGRLAECIRATI